MAAEIGFFEPISWKANALEKESIDEDRWEAVARWSEGFWANLSCRTDAVRVIGSKERKVLVEHYTRKLGEAHYAWMIFELGTCLLVVPLLVMLVAKLCTRYHYTFTTPTITPSVESASPVFFPPGPLREFRELVHSLSWRRDAGDLLSRLLFQAIDSEEDRTQLLGTMINELPDQYLDILKKLDDCGLTLLHYAYLYRDEDTQKCLEARSKELSTIPSSETFSIKPGMSAWGTSYIPKGKNPAELSKYHNQLAARYVLRLHIQRRTEKVVASPYWPWKEAMPSIEEAFSFLDPRALDRLEDGMTLLHLAKHYRHEEIERRLIAKGANTAIRSTEEIEDNRTFLWLGMQEHLVIKVKAGLTADEMSREFWDQFYWKLALAHVKGYKVTGESGGTLIRFPGWGSQEGLDFQEVLSHITTLNRQDQDGLTLMHYAVLFGQQEMQKQLREKEPGLDEATCVSWKLFNGVYYASISQLLNPNQLLEHLVDGFIAQSIEYSISKSSNDTIVYRPSSISRCSDMEIRIERAILRQTYERLLKEGAFQGVDKIEMELDSMKNRIKQVEFKELLRYISPRGVRMYPEALKYIFSISLKTCHGSTKPYAIPFQLLDIGVDPIDREEVEGPGNEIEAEKLDAWAAKKIRWPIKYLFRKAPQNADPKTSQEMGKEKEKQKLTERVFRVIREPITSAVSELPAPLAGIVSEYLGWEPITRSNGETIREAVTA